MSVTTSARLNADQLNAALGMGFTSVGGDLTTTDAKTISAATTDAAIQTAITTAAGQFVDRTANESTIASRVDNGIGQIQTWIANNPNGAVLTAGQTLTLAKLLIGLAKIVRLELNDTNGT